jgi:hypothetical protein
MAEIACRDRAYVSEFIQFGKREGKAAKLLIVTYLLIVIFVIFPALSSLGETRRAYMVFTCSVGRVESALGEMSLLSGAEYIYGLAYFLYRTRILRTFHIDVDF